MQTLICDLLASFFLILTTVERENVLPQWSQESHYGKHSHSVHDKWAETCEGGGPNPPRCSVTKALEIRATISFRWMNITSHHPHFWSQWCPAGWLCQICNCTGCWEMWFLNTLHWHTAPIFRWFGVRMNSHMTHVCVTKCKRYSVKQSLIKNKALIT